MFSHLSVDVICRHVGPVLQIQYNKRFNAHIHSKLLQRTFVVGASSDLGQPFRPRQKRWVWIWEENRLSGYDIRADGALPPSITVIAGVENLGYWICNVSLKRVNSKIDLCAH